MVGCLDVMMMTWMVDIWTAGGVSADRGSNLCKQKKTKVAVVLVDLQEAVRKEEQLQVLLVREGGITVRKHHSGSHK